MEGGYEKGISIRWLLPLSVFDTIEYNTPMKVVFLEDVTNIGKMGEVKEIADGYGRNYLLPRKLALLATPSALKKAEIQVKKEQERRLHLADEMEKLAQQIDGFSLTFKEKVANEDNLYGSVRDGDVADQLNELTGLEIDKSKIELEEPLRKLGEFEVAVRLSKDLTPKIKVVIIAEE